MEEVLKEEENLIEKPVEQQSDKIKVKHRSKRIWELDFIRGFCVLLMVWDHIMYDLGNFEWGWVSSGAKTFSWTYWDGTLRTVVHPIIVGLFFTVSGISATFSKSNIYRALKILIFAYAVSFFTSFVGIVINFGVLHAFGFSILIYALLDLIDKKTIWSKLVLGIVFVVIGALIESGFSKFFKMPDSMQWLNNIIGIAPDSYKGDDYFGLLPWTGVFLLGSVIGRLFYKDRKSLPNKLGAKLLRLCTKFLEKEKKENPSNFFGKILRKIVINPLNFLGRVFSKIVVKIGSKSHIIKYTTKPVEFIGRHALIIYPLHQILVFGLFCLISIIAGYGITF